MLRTYKVKVVFPPTPLMPEEHTGTIVLSSREDGEKSIRMDIESKLCKLFSKCNYVSHEEVLS